MKKIRLFLTMVMIVCSVSALAQKKTVTGTVTDASNGEGVPFVGVTVKGTTTGVATDVNGAYSISVPADAVLVFNAIGYKTAEQTVGSRSVIDVALDTDTQLLDETIVVAYGTTTKAAFTGSAAVLKSDDIAKTQSSNATRAIEGVVPGVQLTTSSGTLGTNPSIRIRGISSITAGKEPLIIVDGAPYSGSMDNLNPTDLESITVLKDAASSALYGARGANGVIIITTKKAKSNQAVVNVDAKWGGNSRALRTYDYIKNPATYYETYYGALYNYYRDKQGLSDAAASLKASNVVAGSVNDGGLGYQIYSVPEGERFIGANGKINPRATLGNIVDYNGEKYLMTPDDWMEAAYRNSLRQEYNVSVSGTVGGKVSILASFGYLNNKGIIEGAD
ncbi:MAG: TonB-dependent receptor plug domain-containing protein, partial [Fibrobacter sp.]|nr:TonB-dependent receptor plug domain-containing protein [Fibrobacter sp.]